MGIIFLLISIFFYITYKTENKINKLESSLSRELYESVKNRVEFDRDFKVRYSGGKVVIEEIQYKQIIDTNN